MQSLATKCLSSSSGPHPQTSRTRDVVRSAPLVRRYQRTILCSCSVSIHCRLRGTNPLWRSIRPQLSEVYNTECQTRDNRPSQVNYSSVNNRCPQRLDSDAVKIRRRIPRRLAVHLSTESTRIQYTPIVLFSVDYPYRRILDTCCADLLHQVSECSWDCMVKKWLRLILTDTASNTKKMKKEDILWKLTGNFRLSWGYPALNCFNSGVFTQKHMWTMREFKMMMQQNPGTNR